MRFIKVMLNVSNQEQAARFAERLTNPDKLYKISQADLDAHPQHDKIQTSFATAMAAASTAWAPTYLLPNDNKLTGWRKMAQIADEVLADMNPHPRGFGGEMDAKARREAAAELRKEVDASLRKG